MKTNKNGGDEFRFNRNDDIGAAAAENDSIFLDECFIDNGDLGLLQDCNNPKCVIIGRTGAGKSALLHRMAGTCANVIDVSPNGLSLNYIANNDMINFFEETGVNLSIFYGLLWKHILVVELLKAKFEITNEEQQKRFMSHIRQMVYKNDRLKEIAIDYFEKYGNKFWLTTEERLKELTETIEKTLEGSISGSGLGLEAAVKAGITLSQEQKKEIVERGQKAVSEVQVRELLNLIDVLDEDVFNDPQKPFYLTIDTLDEEWADERIRFKLIKSLIETVRTFRKIKNVKIIIALRQDLLNKVLHSSHVAGFQEEKYESLYLDLRWSNKMLTELIDSRINFLVKRRYTKSEVLSSDLLPTQIDGLRAIDYIISRTFHRPRDIILFINECIKYSEDANSMTAHNIKMAEEEYSYKRLQSVATEWLLVFPNLEHIIGMFTGMRNHFTVSEITEDFILERYTEVVPHIKNEESDPMTVQINKLFSGDSSVNFNSLRNNLLRNLFVTGVLGIKVDSKSSTRWSTDTRLAIAPGQLKPSSTIYIHPMFYRSLSIITKN